MNKSAVYLFGFAKGANLPLTLKAITFAYNTHSKKLRDDGKTEYFDHPVSVCRYLFNHGVVNDVIGAAALVHDTGENEGVTADTIRLEFNDEVASVFDLLSKRTDEKLEDYYRRIESDIRAVLVKSADRTHNIGNMVDVFPLPRLKKYVRETEEFVLPMMKRSRRIYLQYSDALVVFRDHINDVVKNVKKVIELMEQNEKLQEELRHFKKSL